MFQRTRCSWNIFDRSDAGIKIKPLSQKNIEASNPLPYGCGQRPFNANLMLPNRLDRLLRSPFFLQLKGLHPCIDFEPMNFSLAPITFHYSGIEDPNRCLPDIGPHPIPLNIRNDGLIRHDKYSIRSVLNLFSSHLVSISYSNLYCLPFSFGGWRMTVFQRPGSCSCRRRRKSWRAQLSLPGYGTFLAHNRDRNPHPPPDD